MSNSEEGPGRKYRKLEGEVNPLSSLSVTDALGKVLTSGHLADVIFIVGPEGERREISAHKLILSARSDVFGAMVEERWNNSVKPGENVVRIPIGTEINPLAFEQLIKFVYKDDVEGCLKMLEFEDLFDLRVLADMYGFQQLREAASLKIALDLVQDYTKCYQTLENVLDDKDLRGVAFALLNMHFWEAWISEDLIAKWTEEIWENVLTEAYYKKLEDSEDLVCFIEEIDLFNCLCKWREHHPPAREESFQKLLKLVRFPLMSPSELLEKVRPTHVLSESELLDALQTKLGTLDTTSHKKRKTVYYATTSQCLTNFCYYAGQYRQENEDNPTEIEIMLLPGEYFGVIDINEDYLKLTGFGPYTVFQGRRYVLKITSNHITLTNFTIQSTWFLFDIVGDSNIVKDARVTCKNQMFRLEVSGTKNIFENFFLQSLFGTNSSELDLKSDKSEFAEFCESHDGIYQASSPHSVLLRGPGNKISTFNCTFVCDHPIAIIPRRYQTKFRISAEENEIEDVNFAGASRFFDESSSRLGGLVPYMGARLSMNDDAYKAVVSRCCFAQLKVTGSDANFEKVLVVSTKTIKGAGHKFTNCKFGEAIDNAFTVMTECVTVPEWIQVVKANAEVYNM